MKYIVIILIVVAVCPFLAIAMVPDTLFYGDAPTVVHEYPCGWSYIADTNEYGDIGWPFYSTQETNGYKSTVSFNDLDLIS
jgi:hypothetical protein